MSRRDAQRQLQGERSQGEDLGNPQRPQAFDSYLDRIEGAPQHNARRAKADAEM